MPRIAQKSHYERLITESDLLLKAGKISQVFARISKVNPLKVHRPYRQSLARICRRAGLIMQGLRLLHPVIREDLGTSSPPTPGEICEYSVLLSRNGCVHEALGLLKNVDANENPEAWLSLTYCHMATWEYAPVVGFLQNYLRSSADEYSKLIAQVNLASAFLATSQLDQAEQYCNSSMELAEEFKSQRLFGNALEIRSQVHLQRGDFSRARSDLQSASRIFGNSESYDQLFVQKWQSVMRSIETHSPEPLLRFRETSVARKHWESVREADLFTLTVQFDQGILDFLMFGTPMPAYRERISRLVQREASHEFIYGSRSSQNILDLQTGILQNKTDLNPGKKIHQVIGALLKDFYVPRNVGNLFSELYPQEFFDINSSALRVRQLLWRTREWLRENRIPASIEHVQGTYRLSVSGDFGIRLRLHPTSLDSSFIKWLQLKNCFPVGVPFSSEEACQKLNWPRTSFRLVVNWALKKGRLHRDGHGKATRYKVLPEDSPSIWRMRAS